MKIEKNKNYLVGWCFEYALILKEDHPEYTIECIRRHGGLIHVWCRHPDGKYEDVRGIFEDRSEFLTFFGVPRLEEISAKGQKEKEFIGLEYHTFTTAEEYRKWCNEEVFKGHLMVPWDDFDPDAGEICIPYVL